MITEPTVTLIGQTQLQTTAINQILERFGGLERANRRESFVGQWADKLIEFCGRVCYRSWGYGRKSPEYHQHIKEVMHYSLHEHASFNFFIEGVSRSLTHELIRHRAGMSYSQQSQRFVDEEDCEFVDPPLFTLMSDPSLDHFIDTARDNAIRDYKALVKEGDVFVKNKFPDLAHTERRKMVREAARCVLPNMTETKIVATGNARSWRHFLKMRGSRHADMEIRRLALALCRELKRETTYLFSDIEEVEIENRPGEYELHSDYWEKGE